MNPPSTTRLERFQRVTERPLAAVAVAVALMIGGISLLGVVTATLASWIIQCVGEEDAASQAATAAQIEELRAEIRRLTEAITRDADPTDDVVDVT